MGVAPFKTFQSKDTHDLLGNPNLSPSSLPAKFKRWSDTLESTRKVHGVIPHDFWKFKKSRGIFSPDPTAKDGGGEVPPGAQGSSDIQV